MSRRPYRSKPGRTEASCRWGPSVGRNMTLIEGEQTDDAENVDAVLNKLGREEPESHSAHLRCLTVCGDYDTHRRGPCACIRIVR